ncbi:MAG: LuxR C-terminal-related transcriptional regulator [Gammaproteobacteria bacterium]
MSEGTIDTAALTGRQQEILELAAKGLTNADIARVLDIAPGTVKVHMAAIYRLLDVSNRTEAAMVLRAMQAQPAKESAHELNAIAVLPFDVFNQDAQDEYFADGLVEEIITRLSRWQWFPVIARQSCFAFKRQVNDIRRVGAELGAAYVVEGSVRHSAMGALAQIDLREQAACAHGLDLAARALAMDGECLVAAYALAMGNYLELVFQWASNPMANAQAVADNAALCKRIAPDDPYSFIAEGTACMLRADVDGAIEQLRSATERNPSSARAFSFLGQLLGMRGEPDAGIECLEQAIVLSPRDTAMYAMLASIGVCHFAAERLDRCCHYLHRAAELKDDETLIWSILAAAAALAGWQDEAEAALAELFRVQPQFTLEGFKRVGASVLPAYLDRFEAGIRKAGYVDPD